MTLQLLYNFISTPNPIIASEGSTANVIDLQVMITNPSTETSKVTGLSISIPGGQEGANTLSTSKNLPAPVFDASSGWSLSGSTTGDTVAFNLPASGFTDSVPFIFTLPGIQVDFTPGIVPITIIENPGVADSTTYSLVKQPSDFPITNFYANPVTLNNPGETTTLFWDCTAAGSNYAYCVHSDSWNTQQPDACLENGTCNSCRDGSTGIQTGPINETTIFSLDVIQTNKDGSRSISQTIKTKVQVLLRR